MSRLILVAVIVAALAVLAMAALQAIRAGSDALASARPGGGLMQKAAFVILLALILYVSIWGAG